MHNKQGGGRPPDQVQGNGQAQNNGFRSQAPHGGHAAVGNTIKDRYVVHEELGKGGMGEVFLAWDKKEKKPVAIKFILVKQKEEEKNETAKQRMEREKDNETRKQRFVFEANTMMRMRHPNVVGCTDFGLHEGNTFFLVMEHVQGETLSKVIGRNGKRLSWEKTREYVLQICDGLAEAHKRGVVHRDIKDSNIMLTEEGVIKVMDFGLAKSTGDENLTKTGIVVGTPDYMAPEQIRRDSDHRVDIYAVGVLMYRMLSGTVPFIVDENLNTAERAVAILTRKNTEKAPRPGEMVEGLELPRHVEGIVMKALERDPNDRFQTMEELKDAITGERRIVPDLGDQLIRESIRVPPPAVSVTPVRGMPAFESPLQQGMPGGFVPYEKPSGFWRFVKWTALIGAVGGLVATGVSQRDRLSEMLGGDKPAPAASDTAQEPRQDTFTVKIVTDPKGADVYEVDGKQRRKLGNTRSALIQDFEKPTWLLVEKPGYISRRVRVSSKRTRLQIMMGKKVPPKKDVAPARPPIELDDTEITTE